MSGRPVSVDYGESRTHQKTLTPEKPRGYTARTTLDPGTSPPH